MKKVVGIEWCWFRREVVYNIGVKIEVLRLFKVIVI